MATRFRRSGLVLLLVLLSARVAGATPLLLDNSWVLLNDFPADSGPAHTWFTGTGDLGLTAADATPYTWNSTQSVRFQITDWLVVGDAFRVFDNGLLVGVFGSGPDYASIPGCTDPYSAACHWTNNADVAWLDPYFNQGSLLFAPGAHSLTIQASSFPSGFTDGTVAFRASEVPEPASLLLLGTGLFAAATRWRKHRHGAA